MKTNYKTWISIAVTAFIMSSCITPGYVETRSYYNPSYGYHYGDGQPDGYYYDTNTQSYQHQQTVNVSGSVSLTFNDFYAQLSPHGVWVNIHPYGQVWVANVRNFQPYSTNGYWAYTTYGWTWVSNYPWGWAPFHYGRWGYDNRYGWYWVPGYEWGPAWVVWSSNSDMYGWAPLMPGMNFRVRLTVGHFPSRYWTFMPGRYMGNTNIRDYYVNSSRNTTIIHNTTIINNYGTENNGRYNRGPSANEVQRYTGRNVEPLRVSSTADSRNTGISNNEYRVYRPTGERSSRSSGAPSTDNNTRTTTPSTRTQPEQSANRESTGTSRTQPDQPAGRTSTPSSRTQPEVSPESREYRPTQDQPQVRNSAAPQSTRQIQRAQSDNINSQQQQQVQPQRRQQQDQQQVQRRQQQQQDQQQPQQQVQQRRQQDQQQDQQTQPQRRSTTTPTRR
ncbi:MAG: hypothetical protein LBE79_11190 [Tannerella sp.]|nr:hypothetical protein [Tannerella sp.]